MLIAPEQIDLNALKDLVGDKYYVHYQTNFGGASTEWHIIHNLGKRPSVTITDTAGNKIDTTIEYINDNECYARFKYENNGVALCN